MVKGVESRQTNVRDFFLIESNGRVRRQSIARRTDGRSGRATRQRQRPSDSQYRYGFRPTLSLRISLAMRHGGDFLLHPQLNVPFYTNDGRNAALDRHLRSGSPTVLRCEKTLLIDHLVGGNQQAGWYDEAERLGGLGINGSFKFDWPLNGQMLWPLPPQNSVDVGRCTPE